MKTEQGRHKAILVVTAPITISYGLQLGPTGSVFLMSTNPVFAPLSVYWVSRRFCTLSCKARSLTDSTGSETDKGAGWFANALTPVSIKLADYNKAVMTIRLELPGPGRANAIRPTAGKMCLTITARNYSHG